MTEAERKSLDEQNAHLEDELTKFLVSLPDDTIGLLVRVSLPKYYQSQKAFMRVLRAEHKRRKLPDP